MWNTWFIIGMTGALLIPFIGISWVYRLLAKEKRSRFDGRQRITEDKWHSKFYSDLPRDLVIDILKDVSWAVGIDLELLHPDDRFDGILAPPKLLDWDDDIIHIGFEIEKNNRRLKKKKP